ncbi:GtrA family protein [Paenibacillus konkukensis]|uniref:GtrA family protein n=1 Tax=Paenibacillus konkukensis TaxID=2020716 RepID=UPI003D9BD1CA
MSLVLRMNMKKLHLNSQFTRYVLVGMINTLLTLCVVFILVNVFHVNILISNIFGYVIGLINSFILNKRFTFESKDDSLRSFAKFLIVFIGSFCISYYCGKLFAKLSFEFFKGYLLKYNESYEINFSILLTNVIYTLIGFVANKKFTFNR